MLLRASTGVMSAAMLYAAAVDAGAAESRRALPRLISTPFRRR